MNYILGTYDFFFGRTGENISTFGWGDKNQIMKATSTTTDNIADLVKWMFLLTNDKNNKRIVNSDLKVFHLSLSYPVGRCFR